MTAEQPLWRPSPERVEAANLTRFTRALNARRGLALADYHALYRWSVEEPEAFWSDLWDFAGVIAETRGERILADRERMPGARFFPDARLNFAENLLRSRDESGAIVFRAEDRADARLSHRQLYEQVSRVAQALEALGVVPGDRVAALLPNVPETVIVMLAAASLGAVFTSCSPDFGVQGVLDRFGQVAPKVLFACDGHWHGGKPLDVLAKLRAIAAQLPGVKRVVVVPCVSHAPEISGMRPGVTLAEFLAPFAPREIGFRQLPFNHPLYIVYSSGTTGVPKCIVHGAGGTLLTHLKEHLLHCDLRAGDRLFYYTTCGWMMWNWLVSALAARATLMLYDGSPFVARGAILWDYADAEGITHFGTSAKYLDALAKIGYRPRETHRLGPLRSVLCTGSPLSPEGFDYVYRHVKGDVCLSSISGGTDIIACFLSGCPTLPVWRGEIQCRALAMKVEVYDDCGRPVTGEKGELVCSAPFPTMPLGFWDDPGDAKYRAAYFERFPGVWCHGDWVEMTPHQGLIIHGRSDPTLNPGGVRIGSAEIYRQVERLDEVLDCVVIGQEWERDTRVVLFVKLREGVALDEALVKCIKEQIRVNTSPRHVPAKILEVPDIPHTRSGKRVEMAVRHVVHGEPVKNLEAIANPEALEFFRDRAELRVA